GDHAAAGVEEAAGEVAGFPHDRREGDALQRLGLFGNDADQVRPEDLELDAVHDQTLRLAVMQPLSSTRAVQPGGSTMVGSRSSTRAGPARCWPRPRSLRA